MKSKIAAALVLAAISLFLFAGCSDSFTYTHYTTEDGAICYDYTFTYDVEAADASAIKEKAYEVAKALVEESGAEEYATIDTSTDGVLKLLITYPSITDYYVAHGVTGKEKPEGGAELERAGIFLYYDSIFDPYSELSAHIRGLIGEGAEELPDPLTMIYVYGTPYSTIRSNADRVQKKGGLYYHYWTAEPGTPLGAVIRRYYPDTTLLFGAGICVFGLSLATVFVIMLVKGKKNARLFSAAAPSGEVCSEGDSEGKKMKEPKEGE